MFAVVLAALAVPAMAFHSATPVRARSNVMEMKEMSKALPFLAKPAKLDGSMTESNPLKAIAAVGMGPNLQILLGIGILELIAWDTTFSGNSPAGNFGFDPLGFSKGKSAAQIKELELKEIKNGRLAMFAIMGLIVQNLMFDGKPSI
eukprot:gene11322-23692_t